MGSKWAEWAESRKTLYISHMVLPTFLLNFSSPHLPIETPFYGGSKMGRKNTTKKDD